MLCPDVVETFCLFLSSFNGFLVYVWNVLKGENLIVFSLNYYLSLRINRDVALLSIGTEFLVSLEKMINILNAEFE